MSIDDRHSVAPVPPAQVPTVRLLVVDDEHAVRMPLARYLGKCGYEVHTAGSGAEALALLGEAPFAGMLCDIRMPGLSGVETLVRAMALQPDLAVVMLTGDNDAATATGALAGGASDYLVKPVRLPALQQAVEGALRKRDLAIERCRVERLIRAEVVLRTAELEREKAALRASESRLAEAQQLARVGSWEWNLATDTISWSDELYRLFGMDPGLAPVPHDVWLGYVHADDRGGVAAVCERLRRDGEPFEQEWRVVRPDGATLVAHGRGQAIVQDGRPSRASGTVQDVTGQRELERLKREFVATVSHELRTPLTSVRGALGLLTAGVGGTLQPASLELVRLALSNVERLGRLVDAVVDVGMLDAETLVLHRAAIDPVHVAAAALEEARAAADARGVRLERRAEAPRAASGGRPTVDADRARLLQVLGNLLANAITFSPAGGVVELLVSVPCAEVVRFEVVDAGPGIRAEQLAKLFRTFQQLDGSDARGTGGSGLGLAIAHKIVTQHGGRIGVTSTPGVRTVFWLELARGPACGAPEPALAAIAAPAGRA